MKGFSINGRDVYMMSLTEVSRIVNKTNRCLKRWEKKGILPSPLIAEKSYRKSMGVCYTRYYLEQQCKVIYWWINAYGITSGVKITDNLKACLHEEWNRVTDKFLKGETNEYRQTI